MGLIFPALENEYTVILLMDDFLKTLDEHLGTVSRLKEQAKLIAFAGLLLRDTLAQGKKILLCGNGGSAADAQHIAAELVVRFSRERRPLPAIALTTDTSVLTAHANDYDFSTVFARQIEGLGQVGDCLIAISTSGHSPNILNAVKSARSFGLNTIGLAGRDGGALGQVVDSAIIVPSQVTARVQEAHILIAHWWCEFIDEAFATADT